MIRTTRRLLTTTTPFERLEDRRLFAVPSSLGGAERASIDFTQDWRFIKSDAANAENPSTSTSGWSQVNLPHTYNATDGQNGDGTPAGQDGDGNPATGNNSGGDYYRGPTWYRKNFTYSKSWNTRRVYINVEAAAIKADLYVNGQFVMTHKGDYSGWTADITPYLAGSGKQNTVAIRVDNSQDNEVAGYRGDFTKYGGLTRGVTIFATNKLHVNSASYGATGIKLKQTAVSSASATIDLSVAMRNDNLKTVGADIRTTILDAKGKVRAQETTDLSLKKRKSGTVNQSLTLSNPHLWNGTADPYQYTVYVQVIQKNGSVIDTLVEKLGVRDFETTSEAAFLNGKKIQLRGVNLHDDWEDKGPATTYAEKRKDLQLLKDMGANAVRFAHWQVDSDYYTIADDLGLLVWTEIPLWGSVNNVNSGSATFNDNAEQQLRELIRQNFNHASIVYWGLFNEIDDTANNISLINRLQGVAESEDPTRLTIAASDLNNNIAINDTTDLVTLNKYYGWYGYGDESVTPSQGFARIPSWLAANQDYLPNKPLGIGEYGGGSNVDQHTNDPENDYPNDANNDQTQPEEFQSYLHERWWQAIKQSPDFVFAAFVWQFTDSANDDRLEGDMPGINTKGLITHDRETLKDAYYYYKSQWNSSPMIHLTAKRFTEREDAATTVKAYTNLGVNATLYINGQSRGSATPVNGVLEWDVTLTGGENDIEVRSTKGGTTYKSTATWNLNTGNARGASVASLAEVQAVTQPAVGRSSRVSDVFGDVSAIV